jgi:presenilin-like A22 family membrane protease
LYTILITKLNTYNALYETKHTISAASTAAAVPHTILITKLNTYNALYETKHTISAASTAAAVPHFPMAIPNVANASAGESFTPSPTIPTTRSPFPAQPPSKIIKTKTKKEIQCPDKKKSWS